MWKRKTTASDKFQSDYMEIGVGTTVERIFWRYKRIIVLCGF